MTTNNNLGIYIHLPFCEKRCNYCDFYSQTDIDYETVEGYMKAVHKEISLWAKEYCENRKADSIFIGGGTPSAIPEFYIKKLIEHIAHEFNVDKDAEISIESNPNSLREKKLSVYKSAGINRISIGVQSFLNEELKFLGRIHDADDAKKAFTVTRNAGFSNINIDLMFAFKKEFAENALKSVEQVLKLNPEHISFYSLQLEEGTKLFEDYISEKFELPSEEDDRKTYIKGTNLLKNAGYTHYEISNFAKRGYECRHNLKYWGMGEYIGIGASASSYINRSRNTNLFSISNYVKEVNNATELKDIELYEKHENSIKDDMSDYVITTMRTERGLVFEDFETRYGVCFFEAFPNAKKVIGDYERKDFVKIDKTRLNFTMQGINLSNRFLAEFV
ncbi:MAG: radical SAM family heme chaperone HemW [Eubacteriales bacterium]